MTGRCRLCNEILKVESVLKIGETETQRKHREREAFVELVKKHNEPVSGRCPAEPALQAARFQIYWNHIGIFQRWRLLSSVNTNDPELIAQLEQWRAALAVAVAHPGPPEEIMKNSEPPAEPSIN